MNKQKLRKDRFRLNRKVHLWVEAEQPDDEDEDERAEACFERWYDARQNGNGLVKIGPHIVVDESVFRTKFACVPHICAPGPGQGKWRCCCADIYVPLTCGERQRLAQRREGLSKFLARKEPRLLRAVSKQAGGVPTFWLDEDGDALAQPSGRCVFSGWDYLGRLRCHLHSFARREGIELNEVQPYTCRLFPLLVIQIEGGRILITVLNRENYRAWETLPPWRFPCLSDPTLPPLVKSMALTFDWLFGKGFAKELIRKGRSLRLFAK